MDRQLAEGKRLGLMVRLCHAINAGPTALVARNGQTLPYVSERVMFGADGDLRDFECDRSSHRCT